MSMVNRAAGRSSKNVKIDTASVAKQQITITENVKNTEKEKKQPTPDQIRLASLISDKGETQSREIQEKLDKIRDVTCKTEDEIVTALYDCDNNEEAAISYLLEGKTDGWSTTTKKKKNRAASASKNDTAVNNFKENTDNSEEWDKDTSTNAANQSDKSNRGYRGRRGSGPRPNDRGSYNRNKWRGRENKENERNAEDGSSNNAPSGRDFRGRGDRVMNGPSRLGRGGRGTRGGRGPGTSRTFQSRDNNDRGGSGFPRNIDTWNNPETENTISKVDEFPSPEDWDNEEYTGSLADSKVFTPSTTVEPETADSAPVIESEIKEESLSLQMSMQSSPNAPIQSMVAGTNQLTPAERQYFNQLTAQASENRQKQAQQQAQSTVPQPSQQPAGISAGKTPSPAQQQPSSVIYNSSITSPQQPFKSPVTQSFASVSQSTYQSVAASQQPQPQPTYNAMVSSQTFQQSPNASYQSPSSIPGTGTAASYSRTSSEYTSSNFSDVMNNYNSMHVGLQTNGSLPQRSKPQRPTSRQETPTKVMPGSVDIPSADGSIAIKYLDAQFSAALDFNAADNFDGTASGADQSSVTAALSNKYSQSVAANAPQHGDLPSINSFQASQQPKPNLPSSTIASVLSQTNELSSDASLQNDNSVYSSQTITNSRMAPAMQDLKSTSEVSSLPYGISEAYQSQQQPQSFQKSTSVSQTFRGSTYGPTTPITTSAGNVYSGQQQQQASQPTQQQQTQQQTPQPQQQQSQISGSGVSSGGSGTGAGSGAGTAYPTSSTSFSVYSSNSHSVATATPPLHNSVYHNSSYHPSVTGSFPSYVSYPGSLMQPYQGGAAGLTQAPYLGTQYGGQSLPSLGATYGAAPFHSNYGVSGNMQTPVATLQQTHKISSSLSTSAAGTKDTQYDNLQSITSASSNTANTTSGSVISGLSQPSSTTSSAKVTSSSTSGSKSSGMLPSIPPGVAPLLGPQYIMSQGTLPLYQPAFTLNYDDIQYLQRGMHPPMPTGFVDLHYPAAPQTNLAAAGRDTLSVPFSTISDVRFPRPDNTTSPVPPAAAAAANASLSQQTYAAAYIYPSYQQYTTPVYQVAPTATPAAPGSSNNAALTGTPFAKAPTGYNSTGYASQYDSLGNNQANVGDYTKGNSASSYSNAQQSSKANPNASNVSGQNANSGNSDLSMYGKSHTSLTKSYDKQTFHSGTPPPFTMPGSGPTSSNLGNVPNVSAAAGYGPQLFIPSVPSAAAAHQQHHLHQNTHHQDGGDIRNSGNSERNFFLSSNRSTYR
ncbi:protein lingerer isoform X2 [Planococcus citri]|uniref:protein lingerer isoform X2 n=1 Tax=Planococcus citri TaxID=170843 RepID=UPI0031F86C1F